MPKIHMTSPSEVVNSEVSSGPRIDHCGMLVSELNAVDVALQTLTKHDRPLR